jgi:hypothetical protein
MATEKELKAWARGYNRDMDQLCQALMWQLCNRFGTAPVVYGSADDAWRASTIRGRDLTDAPAGAFGYWAIGKYGHVAYCLGDDRWLMASSHVTERWGNNTGVVTSRNYERMTGAKPRGWSTTNGANDLPLEVSGDNDVLHRHKVLAREINHLIRKNRDNKNIPGWRKFRETKTEFTGKADDAYALGLKKVGRARGWYDGKITTVFPTNGTDHLQELLWPAAARHFRNR